MDGSSITAPGDAPRNPADDEPARARQAALGLLAIRSRSRGELAARLRQKQFSVSVIDALLARFTEIQLLDDRKFAESLVRDRLRAGRRGSTAILAELRRRYVDADTANAALRAVLEDEDVAESSICIRAAAKWLRTHPDDDVRRRRSRLAGFLGRRGFSPDAVRAALNADYD